MKHYLTCFCLVLFASPVAAQDQSGERVLFRSADEVELTGRFYRSPKKRPCVLLLHGVGPDRDSRVWRPLAERLNQDGYAVLTFDFRGHGDSTTVDGDLFWPHPANRSGVRGEKGQEIQAQNFTDRYWPVLVNDIAAAKALLDRKNDAGECDSSNLIVIGADAGAALGAVWLNGECFRYRQLPSPFLGALPQVESAPQAQHMLCALWLNIESKLGSRHLALAKLLDTAARRYRIPMVFLYDRDSAGHKRTSQGLERALKGPRLEYTGAVALAAGETERGENLLVQHYSHTQLVEYLQDVAEDQGDEWQDFDSRKAQFLWKSPRVPRYMPANRIGTNTPFFQSYESFFTY